MKIFNNILALCVFNAGILGSSAFVVQPKTVRAAGPAFSYVGNLETTLDRPQIRTNGESRVAPGPTVNGGAMSRVGRSDSISPTSIREDNSRLVRNVWDSLTPVTVQGGSLKTWSFSTPYVERVQVLLKTEGRPLNANVELWQGPDNTPQKMNIYIEDGSLRPFSCVVETPRGHNAIAIRNTGQMEFPLAACVEADLVDRNGNSSAGLGNVVRNLMDMSIPETIQGGSLKTYSFAPAVSSVQILLRTDGRPLNARVELLQGPNNNKQVMELYMEDGNERPFFAVIETPGSGNVVRVINTAPVEFPMTARVEPYMVDERNDAGVVISDGGPRW